MTLILGIFIGMLIVYGGDWIVWKLEQRRVRIWKALADMTEAEALAIEKQADAFDARFEAALDRINVAEAASADSSAA